MPVQNAKRRVQVHHLQPRSILGQENFTIYNYEGTLPHQKEFLIPHRKGFYLLVLTHRTGATRQWIDMKPYVLKKDTVYITGPNQVIVKEEIKDLSVTAIAFTEEFLSLIQNPGLRELPIIQNPFSQSEIVLQDEDLAFVRDIFAKIHEEYAVKNAWQHRMLFAYTTLLLTYLSRIYTRQNAGTVNNAEQHLFSRFQMLVNKHYHSIHEVGEYADMLHISAGHLGEVVKMQSGKPAIKHVHERILLEARRLLFHTDQSLKEIAYELGFSDASYFTRFFKRETAITPLAYRNETRKMYQ